VLPVPEFGEPLPIDPTPGMLPGTCGIEPEPVPPPLPPLSPADCAHAPIGARINAPPRTATLILGKLFMRSSLRAT
jgi:hypothetical protein